MAAPLNSSALRWIQTIPPTSRYLTIALVSVSSLLFVLRSSLTKEDLKQLVGGGADQTLAFPWLVVVPGYVLFRVR